MKDVFSFDKNCEIILYGALAKAKELYKILEKEGYNVIGFIDKRADEIGRVLDLPVWKIENVPMDKNIVVIMTIKNVFEHSKIAKQLVDRGIDKIVYCPFSVLNGTNDIEANRINNAYNNIMKSKDNLGDNVEEIFNIPKSKSMMLYQFKDYAIINCKDKLVTAFIPIQIIFTAQEEVDFKYEWAEKSILTLPHISLFEYFDGKDNLYKNQYMDFCIYTAKLNKIETTDKWKENIIRSRHMVYNEMVKSLEIDIDFFIRSAQKSIWNDKSSYFNINGGRHRAAFFCEKQFQYMPLTIDLDDYNKYLNMECVKDITMFIEKNNIDELEVPIPHPYFYRFPVKKPRYMNLIIIPIIRFISKNMLEEDGFIDFKNKSLLYIGEDNGEVARYFNKMGCNVCVYDTCNEFEILLNRLFYINKIQYDSNRKLETYDFIYISDKNMSLNDSLISYLLNKVKKYIFIEFNINNMKAFKEKISSHNNNFKYKKLIQAYWNSADIELGVVFIDK